MSEGLKGRLGLQDNVLRISDWREIGNGGEVPDPEL